MDALGVMPYVDKNSREKIDPILNKFFEEYEKHTLELSDGEINYILTRIMKKYYPATKYSILNRGLGVLTAVQLEYYRRVVALYEDKKKELNGDVY